MKKPLAILSALLSFSAFADSPVLTNISKKDVENVSKEFGGNFAHTAVAAPETNGAFGVEFGVVGGSTKSPKFSDVIEASGGDGGDFKNIYHAGLMARVHFPLDLFIEGTYLPEQEFSDVKIKSHSIGLGWNVGGFFNLPVDVAVGFDHGTGDVKFRQEGTIPADIQLKTKTSVYWVGVSKTFLFFTPYAKVGASSIEGDLNATGQILSYKATAKEKVSMSGGYYAIGANFQFIFSKLGVEYSQVQNARRLTGKLSFDF